MNSLKDNLNYCISQNTCFGTSKKNDKNNNLNTNHEKIYSLEDAKGLRDTAKNLSNYLEKFHPEITKVKDLNKELVQEWIDYRSKNWSNRTKQTHKSHIEKINRLVNKTFKSCKKLDFSKDLNYNIVEHKKEHKVRDVAMTREDLNLLKKSFEDSRSQVALALEISSALGLRAREVVNFKSSYIDIENKIVDLPREAGLTKGARARTIVIQDKYINLFELILKYYPSDNKIFSISEDSYNKTLRRHLKELGLDEKYKDTTNHAIRKLWATELYKDYISKGYPDDITTFDYVSSQLGHGINRQDLYKTYILK